MPYDDPKQPVAIFLNLKRRQGMAAARAFGRKHRDEFKKRRRKPRPYRPRRRRA